MSDFQAKFSKKVRSAPCSMERIPESKARYDVFLIFPLKNWLVFMNSWLVFMNDGLGFMKNWSEFMKDGLGFMNG